MLTTPSICGVFNCRIPCLKKKWSALFQNWLEENSIYIPMNRRAILAFKQAVPNMNDNEVTPVGSKGRARHGSIDSHDIPRYTVWR